MGGVLGCLATNLICCCSSAACHCFSSRMQTSSSVATRAAYAILFVLTTILAWSLHSGWVDDLLAKISIPPYDFYQCPEKNCFSGNFATARVLFALTLFHTLFGLSMIKVKNSKDFRAGIQNGWWGPKLLLLAGLIAAAFAIPNSFYHSYLIVTIIGSTIFLFIQLVILIDFAATWSENWVRKWEDSGSKAWLGLLIGTGISFTLVILTLTGLLYYFFCKKGCGLNIFLVTFNLTLGIVCYTLSVNSRIQEVRPSSGILQAGLVVLYATYLVTSALSDETFEEGKTNCNPMSESSQKISTVLGTIFTFVAIAYSSTRAAANSKILSLSKSNPSSVEPQEDALPLIVNEAPAPTSLPDQNEYVPSNQQTNQQTSLAPSASISASTNSLTPNPNPNVDPSSKHNLDANSANLAPAATKSVTPAPASTPDREQELIDSGVIPDEKGKKRHLKEAVESGALPKSALEEEEGEDEEKDSKALSKDDEKDSCNYSYSSYHLIFCLAAMYCTMLINGWSTTDESSGELVNVGHDWATVWVKVVCSWLAILLYIWTLVAPLVFPDRDFS